MTLLELCEPAFQWVCRLNRLARRGGTMSEGQIRAEIKGLFTDMKARSEREMSSSPGIVQQFEKIELPLIFFIDFMVRESRMPGASSFRGLAAERKELAGDEKFFDLLEETLREPGDAANARLAVFYVCIGLGFTGFYMGQPEYLRRKMGEIAARLRGLIEADQATRICPDAYDNVDTRVLTQPPGRSLVGMTIVLVGLAITVVVGYFQLFLSTQRDLAKMLDAIAESPAQVGK